MTRLYFARKKKSEPRLMVILAVLLVLIGGAYATMRLVLWFQSGHVPVEAGVGAEEALAKAHDEAAAGHNEAALELIAPLIAELDDPDCTPRALMLKASLCAEAGDFAAAAEVLRHATETYPNSPHYHVAAAAYAQVLEKNGENEAALALYEKVSQTAPSGMRAPGWMGLARHAEREDDPITARARYRQALEDAELGSEAWDKALDSLGRLNVSLAFSPMETPESKSYIVQPGDNLLDIGVTLNTTQGLLTRANGIDDPSKLRVNQRLKYTPKDFRVVIERSTCRLFLLDKDGLFKRYAVGLGMPGYETALGEYTIGNKQQNPTWFKPGHGPIPPGDPENELGTRWMPLEPLQEGLPSDLGIHGTIAPETIGQYKSHGCPRMRKEDVEELYDLVVRATAVSIVGQFNIDETDKTDS